MGHIYADITLSNPKKPELRPIQVRAMADSGAITMCIPEHIVIQLSLDELEKRVVTLANDAEQTCSFVGPIGIHFDNRGTYGGALVMGDEVLLGAVQMEDMDLVLRPKFGTLTVNPKSPNFPTNVVKNMSNISK